MKFEDSTRTGNFTPLSKILPNVVGRYQLTRQVTSAVICEEFRKVATTLWGEEVLTHLKPKFFQKELLMISVESSVWAQEVQFKKTTILDHFNKIFPKKPVKNIKTCVEQTWAKQGSYKKCWITSLRCALCVVSGKTYYFYWRKIHLHFLTLQATLGHASFILLIQLLLLRIRLTRTGKTRQVSYRIAVAEHTAPIKSKFIEIIGHYNLARNPRELVVDQDRVTYWISHGAKPTSTVASLFKKMGMKDMDSFIISRKSTKKKKKEGVASAEPAAAQVTEAPAEPAATPTEAK